MNDIFLESRGFFFVIEFIFFEWIFKALRLEGIYIYKFGVRELFSGFWLVVVI